MNGSVYSDGVKFETGMVNKEGSLMPKQLLYFNGIDGDTGNYDLPPMSAEELMSVIRGEATSEIINELRFRVQQATTGFLGVKEGVDPTKLEESGWGVIFPAYPASEGDRQKEVDAIREALQPLLQLRRKQVGERFAAWTQGEGKGFRVGADTKNGYLARHGAGPGPADPDKVPYYLLIVGSPADIPYRFQSQLDVQYAVGRIHFKTLDEYAAYAASVVAAETSQKKLPRQAAFFGVANPDDPATQLSVTALAEPLAQSVRSNHPDWTVQSYMSSQATKAVLTSLLGGDKTPSLLFTASHGMKFAKDSRRQLPQQGALLCQDWPGPQKWIREIPQDFYFAGDDLAGNADLLGLIAFFFACYGGGTPQFNEFTQRDRPGVTPPTRPEIAPFPFLAQLPQNMLGRPRGALAVVGHVERAWSYSFRWGKAGNQTLVFESTLKRLLSGHPIGSAVEYFNERYAELSTVLSDELEEIQFGKRYDPLEMAGMWTANNDARGYAIIGDPAVRLPVVQGSEQPTERSVIEVQFSAPSVATGGAAPAAAAREPVPAGPDAAVEFGFGDTVKKAKERLTDALEEFAEKLSNSLKKAFEDASSLQVSTYVTENMTGVTYDSVAGEFKGPVRLRALTHIKMDGDTVVCIPEKGDEIDKSLWAIHSDMVQKAQAHRTELLKAVVSAAAELVKLA
jgi:hypothetical protein